MKHRTTVQLTACLLALMISGAAWAGGDRDKSQRDSAAQRIGHHEQQQPGFVMVQERLFFVIADAPQLYMTSALSKMGQNDRKGAADELRVAADYIEMQKSRAQEEVADTLSQRADKFREMADKVEQGELDDSDKIRKSFAKANLALAKHHNKLAKNNLENDRFVAAGHDLSAASRSLRQAMIWHGEQPSDELVALLENTSHVARNLRTEAVGQQLEGEAQPAAAREAAEDAEQPVDRTGDPRIETTPAQAENISEHARELTSKLDQKIEQFSQRFETDSGERNDNDEDNDRDNN